MLSEKQPKLFDPCSGDQRTRGEQCSAYPQQVTLQSLKKRLGVERPVAILAKLRILTESFDSGLRQLLPKPPANQHAIRSAPPPPFLQNPQHPNRIDATANADFAVGSAVPHTRASRQAQPIAEASTARRPMKLRDQEHDVNGADTFLSPNPKIPISRVQKRQKRPPRASRTAVACENCR